MDCRRGSDLSGSAQVSDWISQGRKEQAHSSMIGVLREQYLAVPTEARHDQGL